MKKLTVLLLLSLLLIPGCGCSDREMTDDKKSTNIKNGIEKNIDEMREENPISNSVNRLKSSKAYKRGAYFKYDENGCNNRLYNNVNNSTKDYY